MVSKAEMAAKVQEIQSGIRENLVFSCWKRAGFNFESTLELIDLPETEVGYLLINVQHLNKQLLGFSPCHDRINIICLGNKCLYSKNNNNKSEKMIELELEEVPQNCKQEDERCETPKNKQSQIISYFR